VHFDFYLIESHKFDAVVKPMSLFADRNSFSTRTLRGYFGVADRAETIRDRTHFLPLLRPLAQSEAVLLHPDRY
jgi:hypothetical protein